MIEQPGGMSQHEMLMELRADMRRVMDSLDIIQREQAMGVERRRHMQVTADSIMIRLDRADSERAQLRLWQTRADGAVILARWALGASMISLLAVLWQFLETMQNGTP